MPVFNREKYVAAAIESVLAQTLTDFEFIIVDDGSRDSSPAIIRAYAERDARVRCVLLEANGGVASARNRGLSHASGEFVAVMDSDDLCLPQRLEKQVAHLRRHPEIGLLGAGAQAVDGALTPLYAFNLPQCHALIVFQFFVGSFLVHPTVMMRRALLEAVGGYQPGRRSADEIELWTRLMWRTRFANLPESLLLYRRHATQNSTTRDAATAAQARLPRARLLKRLWGEAPQATLDRFERMRQDKKFGPRERREAKKGYDPAAGRDD